MTHAEADVQHQGGGSRKMTAGGGKQMHPSVRVVALLEAFKGVVALVAASGLLLLVGHNLRDLAFRIMRHAHLNPAAKYPSIFVEAATHLQNTRLTMIAAGALLYAALRLVESYGLFREAAWAEVLAAVSGAIYIPFELAGLWRHVSWLGITALLVNVVIVGIMVRALVERRRARAPVGA